VLFDEHVEVVTGYSDGVLSTIGADSVPGLTVNAHEFSGSLADDGVAGFVDNGGLAAAGTSGPPPAPAASGSASSGSSASASPASPASPASDGAHGGGVAMRGSAAIPGIAAVQQAAPVKKPSTARRPAAAKTKAPRTTGAGNIPGAIAPAAPALAPASTPAAHAAPVRHATPAPASSRYVRHQAASSTKAAPETTAQQAFISSVAPGAMAAQTRYGIPAAVTIAQAIDESGWGQSELALKDHNLFGIKGSGPAGTDAMPTQEFEDGEWVTTTAYFRVYHNVAESIADHSQLLANTPSYQRAMADRSVPDAFANDLTGVYATDPHYGSSLIALMQLYDLYRYDDLPAAATATSPAVAAPVASAPAAPAPAAPTPTPAPTPVHAAPVHTAPVHAGPALAAPGPAVNDRVLPAPVVIAPAVAAPATAGPPRVTRGSARIPGLTAAVPVTTRYQSQIPPAVTTAFITTARAPIMTAKPLYRDVASFTGISWQLLAACDWLQCQARGRYSPVHGEKLSTVNADGTAYHTKSAALAQCAVDMIELSRTVYRIRLQGRRPLSVTDLANVFAAFRWGGLLRQHSVSAMEFPYSVQGLTAQHSKMRWPKISAPDAPDRPGTRFRAPFGAVPIVLSLDYPATA
jgi:flagellum-specific peptidoglycan hydrolase FlgJ